MGPAQKTEYPKIKWVRLLETWMLVELFPERRRKDGNEGWGTIWIIKCTWQCCAWNIFLSL